MAAAAVSIGGYVLEAGTRVHINWTPANRDERAFGDPEAYRPRETYPPGGWRRLAAAAGSTALTGFQTIRGSQGRPS